MGRVTHPAKTRGSQKWIQLAVNQKPIVLDRLILPHLGDARSIEWRSPLGSDDFAEYLDADFLERIDHPELVAKLEAYWPSGGPHWDALALSNKGDVLLVEAKAHVEEMCSTPMSAKSESSRLRIETALRETAIACDAHPRARWTDLFYQLGNRLAHLYFLRREGVPAWLVLVNFVGDGDMRGPQSRTEWEAAYLVAYHVMGLHTDAELMRYVFHTYPQIEELC